MPCAAENTGLGMQKHLGLVGRLAQTCKAWVYLEITGISGNYELGHSGLYLEILRWSYKLGQGVLFKV